MFDKGLRKFKSIYTVTRHYGYSDLKNIMKIFYLMIMEDTANLNITKQGVDKYSLTYANTFMIFLDRQKALQVIY